MTHKLNFHISDCHKLQLSKQKKAWFKLHGILCAIVEINPLLANTHRVLFSTIVQKTMNYPILNVRPYIEVI